MSATHFFPLAASQYNLRRLLAIRLIVFFCQLLALAYAWFFLALSLDYFLIGGLLLVWVIVNIFVYLRLIQNWVVSDLEFLGHLLFDVLALFLLLFLSGGANNPFVSYFLVPVTISAAILPWSYTWIVAGSSIISYSLLLFYYQALPALMPMDASMGINMAAEASGVPSLHIIGMWFNFLVSAVLITYFVVKMAEEIRSQAALLTDYREENLRDEQILAVATQAAGTAHELGTPLATMAILLTEMEQDYADKPALQKDISLIKQQVARCKQSLKELVSQADFRTGNTLKRSSLLDFIQRILEQWQLIRPEVTLSFKSPEQSAGKSAVPDIAFDSTLQQAIVNILNNAADASAQGIEVGLSWDKDNWSLIIRDYGEGISQEIIAQLGRKFFTTKASGLGVGLVLSQASINRLGGEISIYQHEIKGTVTKIILPLVKFTTDGEKIRQAESKGNEKFVESASVAEDIEGKGHVE